MRIFLVRHGRPAIGDQRKMSGRDLGNWVSEYDEATLEVGQHISINARQAAAQAGCIVSSTLRRSRESAQLIADGRAVSMNPVFREAELPVEINCSVALHPRLWVVFARLAWFCNWSPGVESRQEAMDRARVAADCLRSLARESESVLLVGHGIMNRMIGVRLDRWGWRRAKNGGWAYWSTTLFERREP